MRDHLDMDVTVNDHDGDEDAEAFEQYISDTFSMYRDVDVDVTVADEEEVVEA